MAFEFDPAKIDLKVGLEIHQQLLTSEKLFCSCPITKTDSFPYYFERRLRPAQSELGELDPAAIFEFSKGKVNTYRWSPESACLVDMDEEPPHQINRDAVDTCIMVASLLGSHLVDEVHVMRKIVIDGSNTGGFQRTAVLALGGRLPTDGLSVGVQTVTVEEDASRNLGEDSRSRYFALDRLGVPLVEIALDPVTAAPDVIERVALELGRLLRSTGRVARGLGTIRQDLNVSVMGGRVVEVKGVQKLNLIEKVVAYEATRQVGLMKLAEEIQKKRAAPVRCRAVDVTKALSGTESKVIGRELKEGGVVWCVVAQGLAGLLGWEPYPGVRLGKEAAEVARAAGLGGLIHSDEKSLTAADAETVGTAIGSGEKDALLLLAGPQDKVRAAAAAVSSRLEASAEGVPAETRAATNEGTTRYLRPRPGAQRMYPETDIPDIVLDGARASRLAAMTPPSWRSEVERLVEKYGLSRELSLRLYDSGEVGDFEDSARTSKLNPSFVASAFVEIPPRLAREGVQEEEVLRWVPEVLSALGSGAVAKEATPDLLRILGRREATGVEEALARLGLGSITEQEVEALVDLVLTENAKLVSERGPDAFSTLMGEVMKRARGRADGQLVGRILKSRLSKKTGGS